MKRMLDQPCFRCLLVLLALVWLVAGVGTGKANPAWGEEQARGPGEAVSEAARDRNITLDEAVRQRCLERLRSGLRGEEFWPAMHAAEGLTWGGQTAEVIEFLEPMLATIEDDQQRCGVARELVRAGRRSYAAVMLSILEGENPHGHVHACESLFKVNELGDGSQMRRAFNPEARTPKSLMAAAALARGGSPQAISWLREVLQGDDFEQARLAAWIVGQLRDLASLTAVNAWRQRLKTVEQRHYFDNAAALLGDPAGARALLDNLTHADPLVRTYAAEFAGVARLTQAQKRLQTLLNDDYADAGIRAAQALLLLAGPDVTRVDRDQIVADVYPATAENPRYSEGSVIALENGGLLYLTTEFRQGGSDSSNAALIGRISEDGGRTWGPVREWQENVGSQNVMSATLRRMAFPTEQPQPLGLFYMVKNSHTDLKVYLKISDDEGESFGEPIQVTTPPGYHVMNNDRITRLSSGRWLAPVATTEDVSRVNHFVCRCFLSDDNGLTWKPGAGTVDYAQRGAMEPEVIELKDGRVLMIFRTQLGHIGASYSSDGGETWNEPESFGVRAPESPATIRRIPATGDLLLIWNDNHEPGQGHSGKRTPLSVAISRDEGKTWELQKTLETDPALGYAYTSLMFTQGRAVLSYYIHDASQKRISSRFRSLPVSWFYEPTNEEVADETASATTAPRQESHSIPQFRTPASPPERVLTLAPQPNNPRNSEGDFIELADGRVMFIYSHFEGGAGDHAAASLKARYSRDQGRTWTTEDRDIVSDKAGMNVMSVSLLRLHSGEIALFYLRKHSLTDCRPRLRLSRDEGETWSEPIDCITDEVGYYVMNNDRAVQLQSGRLVLPVCLHHSERHSEPDWKGEVTTYLSDDSGRTWRRGQSLLRAHSEEGRRWTAQEPGLVELSDQRAMLFVRSDAGCQLISHSEDGCETWSPLRESSIRSPLSPASIERIPQTGDLLLVWNNHADIPAELKGKRTPLTAALSRDDGETWERVQNIGEDPHRHYCYTAISFVGEHVLLAHCGGDRRENNGLAETHLTRFPISWLYTTGK